MSPAGEPVGMEEDTQIIVCQGPPRCALEGDEAVSAQEAGCVWCTRIRVFADGSEAVSTPGLA